MTIYIIKECSQCNGTGVALRYGGSDVCPGCNGNGSIKFGFSDDLQTALDNLLTQVTLLILPTNVFYSHNIWEATDLTEFAALSDANKDAYRGIVRMGTIDLNEGSHSRNTLWNMFDAESTTRTALLALLE